MPILAIGRPGSGLTAIRDALAGAPQQLVTTLKHWAPLSFDDLARLAGVQYNARPNSSAFEIGLAPNPLAWPDQPMQHLSNWCFVVSASTQRRPNDPLRGAVEGLKNFSRTALNNVYLRCDMHITLDETLAVCKASGVLSSPASLARAVEQVCRAEITIFDLTNYEPAVMMLLGIRAVIRRGVTLCVCGDHNEPWKIRDAPFHAREISLQHNPGQADMERRLAAGIRQLGQPSRLYSDLPCHDLIRAVPPERDQRGPRSFDTEEHAPILALVPFDPDYTQRN